MAIPFQSPITEERGEKERGEKERGNKGPPFEFPSEFEAPSRHEDDEVKSASVHAASSPDPSP